MAALIDSGRAGLLAVWGLWKVCWASGCWQGFDVHLVISDGDEHIVEIFDLGRRSWGTRVV